MGPWQLKQRRASRGFTSRTKLTCGSRLAAAAREFAPLTPQTLTRPDQLRAELARVRAQGYAAVDQELEPGLRTLAVPVFGGDASVLAAINISVHAARMSIDQLVDTCLPALRQTQATLRHRL